MMHRLFGRQGLYLVVAISAVFLFLIIGCNGGGGDGGGGGGGGGGENIGAGRKASIAPQGLDLVGTAAVMAVNEAAMAATETFISNESSPLLTMMEDLTALRDGEDGWELDVYPKLSHEIDISIDLDDTTTGSDLFPNSSGIIRITGTAEIGGEIPTSATIQVNPLRAAFVTDVTTTDPESGDTVTFSKDGYIDFSVIGTYSLTDGAVFSSSLTLSGAMDGIEVSVTSAEDDSTVIFRIDALLEATVNYTDDDIFDQNPGTMTRSLDYSISVTWSEGWLTFVVTLQIEVDNTVDPSTEKVTIWINGQSFGPFTISEFLEKYGAHILLPEIS